MNDISENREVSATEKIAYKSDTADKLDQTPELQPCPRLLRNPVATALLLVVVIGCFGLGCVWLYNVFFFRPPTPLVEAGAVVTGFDKEMVFLLPETWIGEPFPLSDYIDVGRKLKKGEWTVLIFNHKSPNVNKMLDMCEQLARDSAARKEAMKVALIEAPPFGRGGPMQATPDVPCLSGCLSEAQDWVVGRPLLIVLENGKVIKLGD